jgi:hypothetical protein
VRQFPDRTEAALRNQKHLLQQHVVTFDHNETTTLVAIEAHDVQDPSLEAFQTLVEVYRGDTEPATPEVADLAQAGLPQGSPLSPILFLFFNADLVSSKLNLHQGAVAFVDDYTAWITGANVAENTRIIQNTIIPKATRWASASGATFEAD